MKKYLLACVTAFVLLGCGSQESSGSISKAGSKSRFAISGDYLYVLQSKELEVVDISDATQPKKISKVHVAFDVQTIFSYENYLYVGSDSSMYIYDNTIPSQPTYISGFSHAASCDPVVVLDDVAYVTLNTNRDCWNTDSDVNRLEVIDVKDPSAPTFLKAVDMWSPGGLSADGNNLFICDEESGLKVFDINKTEENTTVNVSLKLKESLLDINCYELIAAGNNLVVSNHKDIRQFDYTAFPMSELGTIK